MYFSKSITFHTAAILAFTMCTASTNCAPSPTNQDDKKMLKRRASNETFLATTLQKMNPNTTQEAGKKPGEDGAETKPSFSNDTGKSGEADALLKPRLVPEGEGETDTGGSTDGSDVPSRK